MDASKQQQSSAIREEDENETQDNTQPAWTLGSSPDSQAMDLAPPATYDPSSFSAPLNAMPTFKPRKSNRISVLAYNTDGGQASLPSESTTPGGGETGRGSPSLPAPHPIGGGPPGLFGSSVPGTSATPSPPPGGPSGIRLPPPPMKNPGSAPAPVPYTKGDFRTAEIVNHWNDPPTQIFKKKAQMDETAAQDFGPMKETLSRIIKECSENVPAPQKRMFEDTIKRLQSLQVQMDNGTVKERIVAPLADMIQALSTRSFAQCHAIHAKLMQTEFDSEGKWLLGFKRLIDLYASLPASS
ncbi:hypothetical protein BGX28_002777 [Mortierella sp. GBA30]|nr:hypothetical protein BGX28_002777 [Mortierella sp. GBA30]